MPTLERDALGTEDARATETVPERVGQIEVLRQSEVDDLQILRLLLHHAVLRLQIAMAVRLLVHEGDAPEDEMDEEGGHVLRHAAPDVFQQVQQVLPLDQLPLRSNEHAVSDSGDKDRRLTERMR